MGHRSAQSDDIPIADIFTAKRPRQAPAAAAAAAASPASSLGPLVSPGARKLLLRQLSPPGLLTRRPPSSLRLAEAVTPSATHTPRRSREDPAPAPPDLVKSSPGPAPHSFGR
ncbi:hypothetical protein N7541_010638 [Penicillium brevicompactum]|uniref:Uncharacterized protein n=1 Tax=Penicillium brevicompactum TaxID=5074 RepID=A0A9W9QRA6_PENBR|nr:hypothetical protein N7541_010638 [Penicillium brevicompactum]